jgi:hypothetical protein
MGADAPLLVSARSAHRRAEKAQFARWLHRRRERALRFFDNSQNVLRPQILGASENARPDVSGFALHCQLPHNTPEAASNPLFGHAMPQAFMGQGLTLFTR